MPPRTRTTTTAPSGRRPKVAGLRAPGRREVSGDAPSSPSGPTPGDDTPTNGTATPDAPAGAAPAGADAPAGSAPDDGTTTTEAAAAPAQADAPADAAGGAADEPADADTVERDEAGDDASDGTVGDAATTATGSPARTPSSKSRRSRSMSPTPAATPGGTGEGRRTGRGGTAVLDRPTRPTRTPRDGVDRRTPARAGRLRKATAPVRALAATPTRLIVTLVAVIVVCLLVGGLAFWQGRQAWTTGPVSNDAVVDQAVTAEVVGQTREAIEKTLSYDFAKLDDSVAAARTMTTGDFTSQYLSVFEQTIRKPATDQKLRQTASVLNIGAQNISDGQATLMVLVQFTATRTTDNQTTNAPGLLSVHVVDQDGRWKIDRLEPLQGG